MQAANGQIGRAGPGEREELAKLNRIILEQER